MENINRFDRKGLELLTLIAFAYGEISEGRAVELLGWSRERIREESISRVGAGIDLYARLANHLNLQPSKGTP